MSQAGRIAMKHHKPAVLDIQSFADHHVITQPNPLRAAMRQIDPRDADDPVARAEKALAGLSGEFQSWMESECARLAAAHEAIKTQGVTSATRNELFRASHDIKGDAATFGFPTAAAAAESLCRIIEHAPDLAAVPAGLIAHHINAIQAIIREKAGIDTTGMAGELSRKLRGVADEYLTAVNRDRPDHLDAILAPSIVPAR